MHNAVIVCTAMDPIETWILSLNSKHLTAVTAAAAEAAASSKTTAAINSPVGVHEKLLGKLSWDMSRVL